MKRKKSTSETNVFLPDFPDIVIPSEVLFNTNLTSTEKLLFGILQNLAQEEEGCYASNRYLGILLGVCSQNIYNAIAKLKRYQFIEVSMEQQNGLNIRKIFINPEFPKIYHNLMIKIEDQLKSEGL